MRKISELIFSKRQQLGLILLGGALLGTLSYGAVDTKSKPKSAAHVSVQVDASGRKVIDLGELEIQGELRRPSLQWLDSSRRLQALLPHIYMEQFQRLEDEFLKPITLDEYNSRMKKEEQLVSN